MDSNPSRKNNISHLPILGVCMGALALILSCVTLAKISSAKNEPAAHPAYGPVANDPDYLKGKELLLQGHDEEALAAFQKVIDRRSTFDAKDSIAKLALDVQTAFTAVAQQMGDIRGEEAADMTKIHNEITKAQEATSSELASIRKEIAKMQEADAKGQKTSAP